MSTQQQSLSYSIASGPEKERRVEALWGLSSAKCYHTSRQLSDSPHTRFRPFTTWNYHLFHHRLGTCIPPNTDRWGGHSQNCHCDTFRLVWVRQDDLRVAKCRSNVSALHAHDFKGSSLHFCVYRRQCKFEQTSVSFLGHLIAKEGFKSSISGRIFVYHRISLQPTIVKFSNQISLKKSNDISKPYVRSLHRVTPVLNHLYLKSSTNAHTFSSGSTQCANPCSDRTTDHTN